MEEPQQRVRSTARFIVPQAPRLLAMHRPRTPAIPSTPSRRRRPPLSAIYSTSAGATPDSSLVFTLGIDGQEQLTCVVSCEAEPPQTEIITSGREWIVGPGSSTLVIPYALGNSGSTATIDVALTLLTYSSCGFIIGSTCTSTDDFSDTALVTGLQVLDQSGDVETSASIQAASGTVYGASGATPEPSSIVLLALGGWPGAVIYSRKRLRTSHRPISA